MKKCMFIGHRDSNGIEEKIYSVIKKLINNGITEFYSGGMGNFDKMCERIAKELGGRITFIPYNIKQIKQDDRLWYNDIICPFGEKSYSKFDIPNRNKWMVEACDICICYVYKNGGAKHTLDYAIKKNKNIIDLLMY